METFASCKRYAFPAEFPGVVTCDGMLQRFAQIAPIDATREDVSGLFSAVVVESTVVDKARAFVYFRLRSFQWACTVITSERFSSSTPLVRVL